MCISYVYIYMCVCVHIISGKYNIYIYIESLNCKVTVKDLFWIGKAKCDLNLIYKATFRRESQEDRE